MQTVPVHSCILLLYACGPCFMRPLCTRQGLRLATGLGPVPALLRCIGSTRFTF
ncbi:hypothetical protein B4098_0520 [Heyndrickxia coagulans]|uniref:Uncharacterized protein n=1 Tax=Heyndrickxia coagulans TaxID=1398 RepID=A0A150K5W3_HEYCO|nr:hypothetical protein B4098_0520 [Heyndrickxia coagulans]